MAPWEKLNAGVQYVECSQWQHLFWASLLNILRGVFKGASLSTF